MKILKKKKNKQYYYNRVHDEYKLVLGELNVHVGELYPLGQGNCDCTELLNEISKDNELFENLIDVVGNMNDDEVVIKFIGVGGRKGFLGFASSELYEDLKNIESKMEESDYLFSY